MAAQEIVYKLLKTIDDAVNTFAEGLSPIQEKAYKRLLALVKELDVDAKNNVRRNVANLRKVVNIKKELDAIVMNKDYVASVAEFAKTFEAVTELQDKYFSTIADSFTPKKVLAELKQANIDYTIEALTDAGIGSGYNNEIKKILLQNITTGGSYADMADQLRVAMVGDDAATGGLSKYAKQIATDAINQYNRSYNQAVASDLGMKWYMYVGSNIKTTRPFCKAMTEKKYFHESEIPQIIKGNIDGKKVSTAGQTEGTTKDNFVIYAGGYNCGHGVYPVSTELVPKTIREKFEK